MDIKLLRINICEIYRELILTKSYTHISSVGIQINDLFFLLNIILSIPRWYVTMLENKIIGGLSIIENNFYNRKDLTPNVCAVYVEKEYCHQGM